MGDSINAALDKALMSTLSSPAPACKPDSLQAGSRSTSALMQEMSPHPSSAVFLRVYIQQCSLPSYTAFPFPKIRLTSLPSDIWGNFIIHSNPTIPLSTVAPHTYRKTVNQPTTTSAASSNSSSSMFPWPALRADNGHAMLNINLTGGHEVFVPSGIDWLEVDLNITQMVGPGLRNQWRIVDAQAWEGGRGKRCDFWREMGAKVPER